MAKARTEGLAQMRARILGRFPAAARAEIEKANQKSADDFASTIRRIMPKGDPQAPELLDTLQVYPGAQGAVHVSLGGPEAPYPLHLEAGHKAADGSHVPAKPFWNPAKRLARKRHRGRAARALRKAVKIATGEA